MWQQALQFLLALTVMLLLSWCIEETFRRMDGEHDQKLKLKQRMRKYRLTKV